MSLNIHLDYETRSKLDVNKVGAWNYAKHPSTEILCLSWSIGNGKICLAHPAFPKAGIPAKNWPPEELFVLILDRRNKIWAHNAFFERVISFFVGFKRLGWPKVLHEQWRCTMSIASYHALPRKLEFVAKALNTYQKDMAGNKVMLKCSSPDEDGEWHENRDDLLTTFEYNKSDIAAEREIHNFLGNLPPFELAIWQLDQKINCIGIPFDIGMAESAVRAVSRAKAEANIAIFELTKGAVKTITLINEWHAWTEKMGYPFKGKSLKQELIEGYLHNPKIPEIIKEAIRIKKSASAASVDKYKAVLRLIDRSDNRVRDGLYYFGAGTGRYAGRGVQIQNFPKGYTDKVEGVWDPEEMGRPFMDEMCDNIVNESFDINRFYTGHSIFKQLRDATRGVIKAKPGHEFLVVDYSTIEARVVMWLADDLEAIRILKESCIYCDMATTIYGYEVIKGVHKDERQLGKQAILGLGYSMGFIKFFNTLQGYDIEISEKTALALLGNDKNLYLKSVLRHRIKIIKAGIDINTHLLSLAACKKIVDIYRAKYDKVVKFWYDTEGAAKQAVENPGEVFVVGKTSWFYDKHRDFLRVLLPSDRCINYHQPRLEKEYSVKITARDKKGLAFDVSLEKLKGLRGDEAKRLYSRATQKGWSIDPNDEPYIRESSVLTYMKPKDGKATRTGTYSGKLVENISQGIARDFMCHSMLLADKKGYNLVMTVHDEIVSEEKKGAKSLKEFEELLCILPDWGEGFPVGVEGFVAERYRK